MKCKVPNKNRPPEFGWIEHLGNGRWSSLLHTGLSGVEYVRERIECAKLCGKPRPQYVKVKLLPIRKQGAK